MKQTTNYQLNQWEKTDRILMEDFNRDNRRIEAGLDTVAGLPHGELICGLVTGEAAERVDLDVSQVDWSRYFLAILEVSTPVPAQMRLYINGASSSSCYHGYVGTVALSGGELAFLGRYHNTVNHLIIPVLYSGDHAFTANNGSHGGTFSTCTDTLDSLSSLTLAIYLDDSTAPAVPAGTVFRLWGMR